MRDGSIFHEIEPFFEMKWKGTKTTKFSQLQSPINSNKMRRKLHYRSIHYSYARLFFWSIILRRAGASGLSLFAVFFLFLKLSNWDFNIYVHHSQHSIFSAASNLHFVPLSLKIQQFFKASGAFETRKQSNSFVTCKTFLVSSLRFLNCEMSIANSVVKI